MTPPGVELVQPGTPRSGLHDRDERLVGVGPRHHRAVGLQSAEQHAADLLWRGAAPPRAGGSLAHSTVVVGIRLSPGAPLGGLDEGPQRDDLYRYLVAELATLDLAFLDVYSFDDDGLLKDIRALWPTVLLLIRDGRTLDQLGADIEAGLADIAPVAKWALANPDLIDRAQQQVLVSGVEDLAFADSTVGGPQVVDVAARALEAGERGGYAGAVV